MVHIRRAVREKPVLQQKIYNKFQMEYLTFPGLESTGLVEHLFSTRLGGVSKGVFSSLNFSYTRGDEPSDVLENYKRVATVLGCEAKDMVASHQTHTTNIRRVTGADKGKGVVIERDYEDIDGLITDEKGIVLATFFADCVPLYFVDVKNTAIGLAHSGWRGTVNRMGECMVKSMGEAFGSRPEDIHAAIGPSICQECYEVSEEVAEEFRKWMKPEELQSVLKEGKAPGKYQLDLWEANRMILLNAGILPENIEVTDICTCHNPEYLFSHRASEGKRGNLGAFMMLKL